MLASIRGEQEPAVALRELVAAFALARRPAVLALDGVHLLRKKGCGDVVASLALHVPDGSTVALAGRALPRGPIARLRAEGGLFEVGSEELALTRRDSERLVRGLGVELGADELDELTELAEGWPAGVYLAALALKDGGAGASMPGGDDRFVSDYLDFELLSRLGAEDVRFLTRTSVLDAMCGPLCDAALESEGSGRKLETLDKANLFLVPLDRRRWSYRYHREFRAYLRAELERREPGTAPDLCRRASIWCEENGEPEAAIEYAHAAGDVDRLASLVGRHTLAAWAAGKRETVETWLGWFDESSDLERHPEIAVLEAWAHGLAGRPSASERWLALAERATLREPLPDGSTSVEPWLAVVRATQCVGGIDADAGRRGARPAASSGPRAAGVRRRSSCAVRRICCSARTRQPTQRWPTRPRRPRASASSPPGSSLSRSARCSRRPAGTRPARGSSPSRLEPSWRSTGSRGTCEARSPSRSRRDGRPTVAISTAPGASSRSLARSSPS